MKRVSLFLLLVLLTGSVSGFSKNWYVTGEFCNWSLEEAIEMEAEEDGTYTADLGSVEGEIKFCADRSWVENFGALYAGDFKTIRGNIELPLLKDGSNFEVSSVSANMRIVLNPEKKTVKFSGFTEDMRPVPWIADEGYFLYLINEDGSLGRAEKGTEEAAGIYTFNAPLDPETKFLVTSAEIDYYRLTTPKEMIFSFLENFQYGVTGAAEYLLNSEDNVNLDYRCKTGFRFAEEGHYKLTLNINDLTLKTEPKDVSVYICGDVTSIEGYANSFITPGPENAELYNAQFKLKKEGMYFTGTYYLKEKYPDLNYPDNLPQFRFFTELLGWTNIASLGSKDEDFFCQPVALTDEYEPQPITKKANGNWGMMNETQGWKSGWVDIRVDLKNLLVYFRQTTSGVDGIEAETAGREDWYTLQGIKVDSPSKGLYIRVRNGKGEKVYVGTK